ncbi:MAG: type II/IV secretion system protein [Planctomycetes bacterium]|nr:type II/IV secretion system protein [Planctomycetota bacterium]
MGMDTQDTGAIKAFWRELGQALSSGKSLPDSLSDLAARPDVKGIAGAIRSLATAVKEGVPFHEALAGQQSLVASTVEALLAASESASDSSRTARLIAEALHGRAATETVGDTQAQDATAPPSRGEASPETPLRVSTDHDWSLRFLAGECERLDIESREQMASIAPVRMLVNLILLQAAKDRASDIHFEVFEDAFVVRYRVDGVLYEMVPPPRHLGRACLNRIKVMANLDIAEHRRAQRGRIALNLSGHRVDMLVDTIPCADGERCSMRLVDESQTKARLSEMGLSADGLATVQRWCAKPSGLVLVTGPAGSGKTTTLYALVNEMKSPVRAIITVEDPIVGKLDGVCQVRVSAALGFGRPEAMAAATRQPCDVLVLDDLPDVESATAACQAALQGRLVLASLCANDPPSAIRRLLDMGCAPYLMAATLVGVTGQRLVRKLCQCKQRVAVDTLSATEREFLSNTAIEHVYAPKGCDQCGKVGYRGRMAIYELFDVSAPIRDAVARGADAAHLRQVANQTGMETFRDAGMEKIKTGLTSASQVMQAMLA